MAVSFSPAAGGPVTLTTGALTLDAGSTLTGADSFVADGLFAPVNFSTDGGRSFSKLSSVESASALGFGKAAPGTSYQALYLIGHVKGVAGVFRSTDQGASWVRINDDAHQWGNFAGQRIVTGDPDVYGRVYIGTNGRGLQYGDPS